MATWTVYPISDVTTGSWTTTPLWSKIDDDSDTDYITSAKRPNPDTFEVQINTALSDPNTNTNHTITVRARGGPTQAGSIVVSLYQGATLKKTFGSQALSTSFAAYTFTLSTAEADTITDYSDLHVRIAGTNNVANQYVYVSSVKFSVDLADISVSVSNAITCEDFKTADSKVELGEPFSPYREVNVADAITCQEVPTSPIVAITPLYISVAETTINVSDPNVIALLPELHIEILESLIAVQDPNVVVLLPELHVDILESLITVQDPNVVALLPELHVDILESLITVTDIATTELGALPPLEINVSDKVSIAGQASYINESFEANPGYDMSWTVTEGSGCTIDPDNTEVTPPPGGGSQVLKMIGNGNGVGNYISMYIPGGEKSDTWLTVYVQLKSLTDGHGFWPYYAQDSDWTYHSMIQLVRSGSSYTMDVYVRNNGANQQVVTSKPVSLDTWYKVDIKYDRTNTAYEVRINDNIEGSGSLIGSYAKGMYYLAFGTTAWSDGFSATQYLDKIWVDDSEYGYGGGEYVDVKLSAMIIEVFDEITTSDESVQVEESAIVIEVFDEITTSDESVQVEESAIIIESSDSISVSDIPTMVLGSEGDLSVNVFDELAVGEYVEANPDVLFVEAVDAVSIEDVVDILVPQLFVEASDSISVSEYVEAYPDQLFIEVSDSVAIADIPTVIREEEGIYFVTVSETITVGEYVEGLPYPLFAEALDAVAVGENVVVAEADLEINVFDSIFLAGDLITEDFEATPGYDMGAGAWTESKDSGCTIDPDYQDGSPPSGRSCLRSIRISSPGVYWASIRHQFSSGQGVVYKECYLKLISFTGNEGDTFQLMRSDDQEYNQAGSVSVQLTSSTYKLHMSYRSGGSSQIVFQSSPTTINLGQWYNVKVRIDINQHILEWWIDDVLQNSITLVESHNSSLRDLRVGLASGAVTNAAEGLFDRVRVSSTGWAGETLKVGLPINVSVLDSINVTEGITTSESDLEVNVLEVAINITDTPVIEVGAEPAPQIFVSDSINIGEYVGLNIPQLFIEVYDEVYITEYTDLLTPFLVIEILEAVINVSDVQPGVNLSAVLIAVDDTIGVTEYDYVQLNPVFIDISETVQVTENIFAIRAEEGVYYVTASDSVIVSEAVDLSLTAIIIQTQDEVGVAESIGASLVCYISLSDTVGVSESSSIVVQNLVVAVADSITVSEQVFSKEHCEVLVSDGVAVTEAVDALVSIQVYVWDAVAVGEFVDSVPSDLFVSVFDDVLVADEAYLNLPGIFFGIRVAETIFVGEFSVTAIVSVEEVWLDSFINLVINLQSEITQPASLESNVSTTVNLKSRIAEV